MRGVEIAAVSGLLPFMCEAVREAAPVAPGVYVILRRRPSSLATTRFCQIGRGRRGEKESGSLRAQLLGSFRRHLKRLPGRHGPGAHLFFILVTGTDQDATSLEHLCGLVLLSDGRRLAARATGDPAGFPDGLFCIG